MGVPSCWRCLALPVGTEDPGDRSWVQRAAAAVWCWVSAMAKLEQVSKSRADSLPLLLAAAAACAAQVSQELTALSRAGAAVCASATEQRHAQLDSTIAKGAVDDLAAGPATDAGFLGAGRELRAKDVERCGALLEDVKARIKKKDTKELKEELETVLKVQACLEDGKDVRCRLVMLAQPPCGCAGRGRAAHDCAQWGADAVRT